MAIWVEPVIVKPSSNYLIFLTESLDRRINFEIPLINWRDEPIKKDIFLTKDSPIIVDLMLQQKWGL